MSYSCADFTDDVLSDFVRYGLIKASDIEDDDPEQQAGLVRGALTDVLKQFRELDERGAKPALPAAIRVKLDGGLIHDIEFIPPGVRIEVWDFDTEGADEDDLEETEDGSKYYLSVYEGQP